MLQVCERSACEIQIRGHNKILRSHSHVQHILQFRYRIGSHLQKGKGSIVDHGIKSLN